MKRNEIIKEEKKCLLISEVLSQLARSRMKEFIARAGARSTRVVLIEIDVNKLVPVSGNEDNYNFYNSNVELFLFM